MKIRVKDTEWPLVSAVERVEVLDKERTGLRATASARIGEAQSALHAAQNEATPMFDRAYAIDREIEAFGKAIQEAFRSDGAP